MGLLSHSHVARVGFMVTEAGNHLNIREYLSKRLEHRLSSDQVVFSRLEPDIMSRIVSSDHDVVQGVFCPDVLQHLKIISSASSIENIDYLDIGPGRNVTVVVSPVSSS